MMNKRNKGFPELPWDTIIEILSWLPVKSLLRYKCVSKQWCSLIHADEFILKHLDRSRPTDQQLYHNDRKNFTIISTDGGLMFEKSLSNSRVYRIRNPATQQVLYLPVGPEKTNNMDFVFNSSTCECKVVCCCWEENEIHYREARLKIITVGKDEQWRSLILPNQDVINGRREFVKIAQFCGILRVQGVAHLTQIVGIDGPESQDYYLQVQSLDVWRECFSTTTLPHGVFQDLTKVRCYLLNSCTTVMDITEETIDFISLEDYKEHRWSENKIKIPLKVLKDCPQQFRDRTSSIGVPLGVSYDFTYDKKRGILTILNPYGQKLYKPSLMTLKGMTSKSFKQV